MFGLGERMQEDRAHIAANDAERERLRVLVTRLGDADLGRPMPAGWTVAAVLAHLGFWDARAIALLDKWGRGGASSKADYAPDDIDWINDAGKPLCLALPPREAARLALRLAEEVDAKVAALDDEALAAIRAAGSPFNLARAVHRKTHLDEIERVLGA